MRSALARLALALCACALVSGCGNPWGSFERKTLNPGVRSNATPADVGLKFERPRIVSGARILDGFVVSADASCPKTAAVLIFHGRGETVADWIGVQKRLHEDCISSMVFDYSGHGRSSPPGTIDNLNADAVAATAAFLKAFPRTERRCLLSHSMGGGPMLYAATRAGAKPDCVVIASPFTSLRDMAVRDGMPRWFAVVMPDAWDNVEMVKHLSAPMLWLHSRSDTTIPFALGEAVYNARSGPKSAVAVNGFDHNAIYAKVPQAIWSPIVAFILERK
jgi:alpha-beta hydrolase superfamily lysophospholipase